MPTDFTPLIAIVLLTAVLAGPALLAVWRRNASREASEVAVALESFAVRARSAKGRCDIEPALAARMARLRLPELGAFWLAPNLPQATPELIGDAAARLASRLRRRIAFERKMLARTAAGRRRGAVAGALPPLLLLLFAAGGVELPVVALLIVAFAEGLGCWLLARIAHVAP